jgi:hypothetical protein
MEEIIVKITQNERIVQWKYVSNFFAVVELAAFCVAVISLVRRKGKLT